MKAIKLTTPQWIGVALVASVGLIALCIGRKASAPLGPNADAGALGFDSGATPFYMNYNVPSVGSKGGYDFGDIIVGGSDMNIGNRPGISGDDGKVIVNACCDPCSEKSANGGIGNITNPLNFVISLPPYISQYVSNGLESLSYFTPVSSMGPDIDTNNKPARLRHA